MNQECLKWLMRGGTTVLLAGAVGLLLWQGTRHVSEKELSARPQRLAAATVETTGTTGGSCTGSDVPAGSESGDGGGTGTDSRDAAGTGGEDRGVPAADSGVFVGI